MDSHHAFLIRSERKVIEHCRRLLAQDGLSEAQAQRLQALLAASEAELARMTEGRY